jgi:acyl homoserine lactone synthase
LKGNKVRFITGTSAILQPALMADMARYRHKVFVRKLGWQLQCKGELEFDEFDRDDTVYVIAKGDNDNVVGTARLLPTTRPYLLAKVFPDLWGSNNLPNSPEIWEISRFAAANFNDDASAPLTQFSSQIAIDLLRESIAVSVDLGAKQVISVSPLGIERLLRNAGFHAYRAGPPILVDSHTLFACCIDARQSSRLQPKPAVVHRMRCFTFQGPMVSPHT